MERSKVQSLITKLNTNVDTFRKRVIPDSGIIKSDNITKAAMAVFEKNDTASTIRFAWFGEGGSKLVTESATKSTFEKLYSSASELVPVAWTEKIVNTADRDFSSDTGYWTKQTGWTISGGTANFSGSIVGGLIRNNMIVGNYYRVTFDLIITAGAVTVQNIAGANNSSNITTSRTVSVFGQAVYPNTYIYCGANTICSIDNISVQEATFGYADATAITANRPYLSGNIAPNERYALNNPNGASRYITHPTISFTASDAWSVTTVLNWNGNINPQVIYGRSADAFGSFKLRDATFNRFSFSNLVSGANAWNDGTSNKIIGKTSVITFVADGAGNVTLYVNGISLGLSTFTSTTAIQLERILWDNTAGRNYSGKLYAHIIRSGALTPTQITSEYNFFRSIYPEIETVKIGTQDWATSNLDMVCTPMGNVINEITDNANVEKCLNQTFDTNSNYSSSSGVTFSGGTATLDAGVFANPSLLAINSTYTKGWIKVTVTIVSNTTGNPLMIYNAGSFGGSVTATNVIYVGTNAGTYTTIFKCDGAISNSVPFRVLGSAGQLVIDNVSIQQVGWSGLSEVYDYVYATTAEAQSSVEKVTVAADRDFSSDTGFWNKSNVTIGGNVAVFSSPLLKELIKPILSIGKYYKITVSISRLSTGVSYLRMGNATDIIIGTSVGTYTIYAQAQGTNINFLGYPLSDYDLDNISVKELGITANIAVYEKAACSAAAAWCYYNNDSANGAIYGKLYNWYAAKTLQNDIDDYNTANPLTPWGYRVPTSTDFTTLQTNLGGSAVAGGKMKVTGLNYWTTPNTGADNSSGFSALGGGGRFIDGGFIAFKVGCVYHCLDSGIGTVYYPDNASTLLNNIVATTTKMRGGYLRLIKN